MRARAGGLALLVAALLAAPVRADDESPEVRAQARRHFEAAEAQFERGMFPEALVEYEAGYKLTRLPGFLINIAQCHRLMGELKKARAFYRKYLLVMPVSPRRQEIEDLIGELDRAIADAEAGPSASSDPPAKTPQDRAASTRWWVWSALASSLIGSTVAASALAGAEPRTTGTLIGRR